jgi:hypothetical protein
VARIDVDIVDVEHCTAIDVLRRVVDELMDDTFTYGSIYV